MVKNSFSTFKFNEIVFDKIISLSIITRKSRSATIALAVDYFYEIVKCVKAPRDENVEKARKLLVFDNLGKYIDDMYYKPIIDTTHQISARWEVETVSKLTEISRILCIPNRVAICIAIYSYWESFNKSESESILSRLERIVAILKE